MRRKIMLWDGPAPYSEKSPDQEQPSVMDFAVPGSKGAVIVAPGGGYRMKADHEGAPIAEMINEAGVSAFVLDYRVAPCDMCAPLADIKRAVRVVRSLGYERVAILGFSAGGHLVCSAATMYDRGTPDAKDPVERLSSRPDAFIPCYAVVSFAAFLHSGSRQTLLGEKAEDWPTIRKFSAELHVTEDTPEAFIWHTAADQGVPVENSLAGERTRGKRCAVRAAHLPVRPARPRACQGHARRRPVGKSSPKLAQA
jgi:acetyl esterase/lipase